MLQIPNSKLFGILNFGFRYQVSLADTEFVKIITLYEPDEDKWIDYSKRR